MNTRTLSSLLVLAASFVVVDTVAAAGSRPALTQIIVDCQTRALPSQADVGRVLGIDNFTAAYAARSRLMVDVAQACQRRGAEQVRVTVAPAAGAKLAGSVASTAAGSRR